VYGNLHQIAVAMNLAIFGPMIGKQPKQPWFKPFDNTVEHPKLPRLRVICINEKAEEKLDTFR